MEPPENLPPPSPPLPPSPLFQRRSELVEDSAEETDDDASKLGIALAAGGSCLMVASALLLLLLLVGGYAYWGGTRDVGVETAAAGGRQTTGADTELASADDQAASPQPEPQADAGADAAPANPGSSVQQPSAPAADQDSGDKATSEGVTTEASESTATSSSTDAMAGDAANDQSGQSGQSNNRATQPSAASGSPTRDILSAGAFFGLQATGKSVVYVVDCSGSMQGPPFDRAKFELLRSVRSLHDAKLFVILFSDTHYPMYHPGVASELAEPTPQVIQRLKHWLDNFTVDGGTDPSSALQLALQLQPETIFLLSDGEIDEEVRTMLRHWNTQQTRIHTIGFINRIGEPLLKQIAADHRGEYRFIAK